MFIFGAALSTTYREAVKNNFPFRPLCSMAAIETAKLNWEHEMYLVLMISNNRVSYAKAFDQWDSAVLCADNVVMDIAGVSNDLPDWENGDYRTVYEHTNGTTVTIETLDGPGAKSSEILGS